MKTVNILVLASKYSFGSVSYSRDYTFISKVRKSNALQQMSLNILLSLLHTLTTHL